MKKLLLATVALGWFALDADPARAQCNGIFPNNTICANVTGSSNTPRATALSSIPCSLATIATAGCVPAIPNNTTTFLRGDLSFAGLNFAAMPSINNSTVLGNFSGGSAVPSANSVPSCANDGSHALVNPSSAGFACATISSTGDVVGPGSSTDNAAARFDSTTGKLIQNSALIIADTTGALSRSGGGGVIIQGTNTNDNAAAGDVGEIIETTVLIGAAVAATTTVTVNFASVSLTAGDWDTWSTMCTSIGGGTTFTFIEGAINSTSATLPTRPGSGANIFVRPPAGTNFDGNQCLAIGSRRASNSGTTTWYAMGNFTFAVSTLSVYGYIGARRRR